MKKKKKQLLVAVMLAVVFVVGIFLGANAGKFTGVVSGGPDAVSAWEMRRNLANKNFTLINVHTPYEGEIEKTDAFISYDQLIANSASLPADKNSPIVLYCKTGRMSEEGVATLKKMGYTNVKHLAGGTDAWKILGGKVLDLSTIAQEVIPESGSQLPVSWGDLGPRLLANGTIDLAKFKQAVPLTAEQEEILTKGTDKKIKIDGTNVQFVVDLLWGIGLAQKSLVYDEGPMGKEYKATAGNFASTGGWTLSREAAMQYYNKFDLIALSADQQKQVAEIAKNVYRPCCGNSTYFPDCNHGMAALAMIEMMVSSGVDEKTIYRKILEFNSYWFSDTYLKTATYFARQGVAWRDVDAKEVMGVKYSSGQGAAEIAKKVGVLPGQPKGGSSCGA